MAYLLDTSAWLAHVFDESGAEEVDQIFTDPKIGVYLSVLSLLEVYVRLKAMGRQERWPAVYNTYAALFTKILPIDEQVVMAAIQLRAATPARLPTVDGLIAATAAVHNLVLVYRDLHLASIPVENVRQMRLSDK